MLMEVVAVVSLVGSGAATCVAILARSDARKSAAASETSAQAAVGSLELQRAEVGRVRERTDVTWERVRSKRTPGIVRYRNLGSTPANEVVAVIRVNGSPHEVTATTVPPDGTLELDATEQLHAAQREATETRARYEGTHIAYLAVPHFKIRARITWESELGNPGVAVVE